MEIARRDFLATFGGILAKLALRPSPAVYQEDDLYINRRLGIAFSRPPGWNFARLEEMGDVQQGQLLAVDDAEQNAAILSSLDLPFVALLPDETFHAGDPSAIQFYLAEPPATIDVVSVLLHEAFGKVYQGPPDRKFSAPMQIIRRDWQIYRKLLHVFKVCSLPEDLMLSNCRAAEYTATYEFRHLDLPIPRTIRVRTIALQHDSRFYLLRLIDTENRSVDFSSFFDSLRVA